MNQLRRKNLLKQKLMTPRYPFPLLVLRREETDEPSSNQIEGISMLNDFCQFKFLFIHTSPVKLLVSPYRDSAVSHAESICEHR